MNYIELINAFWRIREGLEIPLTSLEADIYFCLLKISNERNWQNPFFASNTQICGTLNISEKTLIKGRQSLQNVGLINFESGKQNKTKTSYKINSTGKFTAQKEGNTPSTGIFTPEKEEKTNSSTGNITVENTTTGKNTAQKEEKTNLSTGKSTDNNKTKKTETNKILFSEAFKDFKTFREQLPEWSDLQCKHWFEQAEYWSSENTAKKIDWIKTVKIWQNRTPFQSISPHQQNRKFQENTFESESSEILATDTPEMKVRKLEYQISLHEKLIEKALNNYQKEELEEKIKILKNRLNRIKSNYNL
ncbi:MAG: hypothetical protein MUC49_14965 [Raineya sp.]|jgi:hypothetical protein|nr:hypothetical protein [Raineya sp.]